MMYRRNELKVPIFVQREYFPLLALQELCAVSCSQALISLHAKQAERVETGNAGVGRLRRCFASWTLDALLVLSILLSSCLQVAPISLRLQWTHLWTMRRRLCQVVCS